MLTSEVIAKMLELQGALSMFSLLNLTGSWYPDDTEVQDYDTYDYLVCGGGTSGGVIAARLIEAGFSVLVLEAGGDTGVESLFPGLVTLAKNSRNDWNFIGERNVLSKPCRKPGGAIFGKGLGGSGATNYMIYGRGNPTDFKIFADAANDSSWEWDNMLQYFKKSEKLQNAEILASPFKKYHSTEGKIGVIKENRSVCEHYLQGFEDAGETVVLDNVGPGSLGYSTALYHIFEGVRSAVADSYLAPLKNNSNFYLTRNSLVTQIDFDENKNAVGVKFLKNGRTITVKARNEVIVCSGVIKSPQLLMLSGIGVKKDLESMGIEVISNLPVGKNLKNPIATLLPYKTNRQANPPPFNAHNFPTPLIIGYAALDKCHSKYPEYETLNFIIDDYEYMLAYCGITLGLRNPICDILYKLADNTQVLFSIIIKLYPESHGQVLLRSRDPKDQPRIIYNNYSNDKDLEALVKYILDFIKIEEAPIFQDIGLEFLDGMQRCNMFAFGSREYWRCYASCLIITTIERSCGTCAVGSVVDNKLLVYGVKKLRVVDASVMPEPAGSAVFASVVAIAEKAAEMIIKSNHE